jgi:hypothetical protein
MTKRMMIATGMLVVGCWLGQLNAQAPADKKGLNASPKNGPEGSAAAVSVLRQAGDLVRYARENQAPLAMLTAVEMLERVRVRDDRTGKPASEKDPKIQVAEGSKGKTPEPTLDPQKLLAEAKPWAQRDAHLLALIDAEAAKTKSAAGGTLGVTGGPVIRHDRVLAGYKDTWRFNFRGGELARVTVIGDDDTDLDLYIYDENGNLITKDDDYTDHCIVEFWPYWTGQFSVVIVNRGNVYNAYMLVTN